MRIATNLHSRKNSLRNNKSPFRRYHDTCTNCPNRGLYSKALIHVKVALTRPACGWSWRLEEEDGSQGGDTKAHGSACSFRFYFAPISRSLRVYLVFILHVSCVFMCLQRITGGTGTPTRPQRTGSALEEERWVQQDTESELIPYTRGNSRAQIGTNEAHNTEQSPSRLTDFQPPISRLMSHLNCLQSVSNKQNNP